MLLTCWPLTCWPLTCWPLTSIGVYLRRWKSELRNWARWTNLLRMLEHSDDEINRGYSGRMRDVDWVEKGEGNLRFCFNDFFLVWNKRLKGHDKERPMRSLILFRNNPRQWWG
jgi:hypothetical protein